VPNYHWRLTINEENGVRTIQPKPGPLPNIVTFGGTAQACAEQQLSVYVADRRSQAGPMPKRMTYETWHEGHMLGTRAGLAVWPKHTSQPDGSMG
jgi:hypothetical protein